MQLYILPVLSSSFFNSNTHTHTLKHMRIIHINAFETVKITKSNKFGLVCAFFLLFSLSLSLFLSPFIYTTYFNYSHSIIFLFSSAKSLSTTTFFLKLTHYIMTLNHIFIYRTALFLDKKLNWVILINVCLVKIQNGRVYSDLQKKKMQHQVQQRFKLQDIRIWLQCFLLNTSRPNDRLFSVVFFFFTSNDVKKKKTHKRQIRPLPFSIFDK